MVSLAFQDAWNVMLGRRPMNERSLVVILGLSALTVCVVFITLLVSYRPVPVTPRLVPRILPVTEVSAPAPVQVVPVVLTAHAAAPAEEMVEYTVRHGDTLIAIARRYCGDYLAIARDNAITDPNWIYADKTVLRFKNGCTSSAPSVLVNRNVSPRELASDGEASSGKHIPKLVIRAPEAEPLPPAVAASQPVPTASQPVRAERSIETGESPALSEVYHKEIYRKAALLSIPAEERTKSQNAELYRLTMRIRPEVLARYPLPNPDCLYAEGREIGRSWEEQTLYRARCIRENYGQVIDETAAEHKLAPAFIAALIIAESGGKPDAISPTGCTGLKQFCRGSAKLFGLRDRFDPFESIRAGGRHIEDNLRVWRGNLHKATAHWNGGSVMVGEAGFNAAQFPFTRNVLRIQRLIEKESTRLAKGVPGLVPVAYTSARWSKTQEGQRSFASDARPRELEAGFFIAYSLLGPFRHDTLRAYGIPIYRHHAPETRSGRDGPFLYILFARAGQGDRYRQGRAQG